MALSLAFGYFTLFWETTDKLKSDKLMRRLKKNKLKVYFGRILSPGAWLSVGFEEYVIVYVFMNGKYSSNDYISSGCHCLNLGVHRSWTSYIQISK